MKQKTYERWVKKWGFRPYITLMDGSYWLTDGTVRTPVGARDARRGKPRMKYVRTLLALRELRK